MLRIFRSIPLILQYAPLVYSAVVVTEQVFGSGKSGTEKKELVVTAIKRQANKYGWVWGEAAANVVGGLIDTAVGIFNLIGIFRGEDTPEEEEEADEATKATVLDPQMVRTTQQNIKREIDSDPELRKFLERMER